MKHTSPAILQALDAATGRELWRYDKATPIAYIEWPDVFAIGDTVWIPDRDAMTMIGLDTVTGEEKTIHAIEKVLDVAHHHRCYPNRATENFAILGRRGAEFVDLKTGEITLNHWLRTGCRSGHVLGNGLFYRPPDHCQCYMQFQPRGFLAMSTGVLVPEPRSADSRLFKGPAFASAGSGASTLEPTPTGPHSVTTPCAAPWRRAPSRLGPENRTWSGSSEGSRVVLGHNLRQISVGSFGRIW